MQEKGMHDHPVYIVLTGQKLHIGVLYFQNDRVIILLHNLVKGVDLVQPKPLYKKYVEHEAGIFAFPKTVVGEV